MWNFWWRHHDIIMVFRVDKWYLLQKIYLKILSHYFFCRNILWETLYFDLQLFFTFFCLCECRLKATYLSLKIKINKRTPVKSGENDHYYLVVNKDDWFVNPWQIFYLKILAFGFSWRYLFGQGVASFMKNLNFGFLIVQLKFESLKFTFKFSSLDFSFSLFHFSKFIWFLQSLHVIVQSHFRWFQFINLI